MILQPHPISGTVAAIASKSQAHRMLICAALSREKTTVCCPLRSKDIEATASCLSGLGAVLTDTGDSYVVHPNAIPATAECDCGESGSTLRFLLPVAAALGVDTTFILHGRLPERPLSPLWEELERHGCTLSRPTADTVRCRGKLQGGLYSMAGNISSQFISGLLFALPLTGRDSRICLTSPVESGSYIAMTLRAMRAFDIVVEETEEGWFIPGGQHYHSPGTLSVEGDWSNAAFWLCAGAISQPVTVTGLSLDSPQGDRAILDILSRFGAEVRCSPVSERPNQPLIDPCQEIPPTRQEAASFQTRSDIVLQHCGAPLNSHRTTDTATHQKPSPWGEGAEGGCGDTALQSDTAPLSLHRTTDSAPHQKPSPRGEGAEGGCGDTALQSDTAPLSFHRTTDTATHQKPSPRGEGAEGGCGDTARQHRILPDLSNRSPTQADGQSSMATVTVHPTSLRGIEIDATDIPDLVPPLALVAACAVGTTRIYGAARLRIKESDRLQTVADTLNAIGAKVEILPDGLLIHGIGREPSNHSGEDVSYPLRGGAASSHNDHRIAMLAGIASAVCAEPIHLSGEAAVEKSYPHFWADLSTLRNK